jgi:hypothetical protein
MSFVKKTAQNVAQHIFVKNYTSLFRGKKVPHKCGLLLKFSKNCPMKTIAQRRIARWFLLRPKLPIWVYFGGPWNGKYFMSIWNILQLWDIFNGHLVIL